jgi:hypothetical protein
VGEPAFDDNFRLPESTGLFAWRSILEQILVPFPSVKIMVSSDWRRLFDNVSLIRLLGRSAAGLPAWLRRTDPPGSAAILAEARRAAPAKLIEIGTYVAHWRH